MASGWCKAILIGCLRTYQRLISPLLGPRCRFYPTCSEYAVTCLRQYAVSSAVKKTVWRLLKCHPFHPGGVDLP